MRYSLSNYYDNPFAYCYEPTYDVAKAMEDIYNDCVKAAGNLPDEIWNAYWLFMIDLFLNENPSTTYKIAEMPSVENFMLFAENYCF